MGIAMSYEMNRSCPGCNEKHTLYLEGRSTPSNLEPIFYICPKEMKEYKLTTSDVTVWKEEFSIPYGSTIATIKR